VNPAENWMMQGRGRVHQEMQNRRLKTWGILSQVFHHHITMHGDAFRACVAITQLTINNGELLFEVECVKSLLTMLSLLCPLLSVSVTQAQAFSAGIMMGVCL
jgi:hypothetical protein